MCPEGTDWEVVWNTRVRENREAHAARGCACQWERREAALAYWRMARDTQRGRIEAMLRELQPTPASRVLDIGSGPGVLALPLAGRVAHVTAVDASQGMIDVLGEKAAERGIRNIRCVPKRWEDVDAAVDLEPPYDLAVACLSLAMVDIRESLRKMEIACRGRIHLHWFTGEPAWEAHARELMPRLHGISHAPLPKCDVLLRVLEGMGVRPQTRTFPYLHVDRYGSLEEAVSDLGRRMGVRGAGREALLREHARRVLVEDRGAWVLRSPATCLEISWWSSERNGRRPSRQVPGPRTLLVAAP